MCLYFRIFTVKCKVFQGDHQGCQLQVDCMDSSFHSTSSDSGSSWTQFEQDGHWKRPSTQIKRPFFTVWQGTVVIHDGLDILCWRNFSTNSENTTVRSFNCFTSVSSVTMFANWLGNLAVLSERSIWVKTSDMRCSLLANEFWLRISSVLFITCSKKLFTSESSSSCISSAIFTIPAPRSNFPLWPRPPLNWINECEDWMNKDCHNLNRMNMKIASNELQIELNKYNNWIETI